MGLLISFPGSLLLSIRRPWNLAAYNDNCLIKSYKYVVQEFGKVSLGDSFAPHAINRCHTGLAWIVTGHILRGTKHRVDLNDGYSGL